MIRKTLSAIGLLGLFATPGLAQHSEVSAVAVNPTDSSEIWVANRGNDSVSVIDTSTNTLVSEIAVGVWPRSLAFSNDGSTVFVANQRGNVPITTNFLNFTGSEIRGTVSVIDTGSGTVTDTLTAVGIEPIGISVAPNGEYFAVTGFRSGTVKFFSTTAPYAELLSHQFMNNLSFLPVGKTILDADADKDWQADQREPRGFVITSTSDKLYITHTTSPWITVLDLTLNGSGEPTAIANEKKFSTNEYPFDIIFNPTPVQTIESQGLPRFQTNIALAPNGQHAIVPGLLHNINHDVNHDFGPGLAGDFANRVYPTITVLDTVLDSFGQGGDDSNRLHHELADDPSPSEWVVYGQKGIEMANGGIATLGGVGAPNLGGTFDLTITGGAPGDFIWVALGSLELDLLLPPYGNLHVLPIATIFNGTSTSFSIPVPADAGFDGLWLSFQAGILDAGLNSYLTNGMRGVMSTGGYGTNKMGHRAGHPEYAAYDSTGNHAIILNRGSEDVFLYDVSGSDMTLRQVFPPRHLFTERTPLDTTTAMGDLPLGMVVVEDSSTPNHDARVFIVNEITSTLTSLWVDFDAGVIVEEAAQLSTLAGPDDLSVSARIGQEIFEDASRAQTTGNFNNSCASCHFEGGDDANVWQRPAGPRSTMPVYGGTLLTGTILWKGVRVNMGETGPMFGGENGGTGIFTDVEQAGLRDYHEEIPVPLNPNLLPNGDYTANAELGKDLFFGTNETGLNPTLRSADCATCHPDEDGMGNPRGYTTDFLDPELTGGEQMGAPGTVWEDCLMLQENILGENLRNVNSGVNIDLNFDTIIDPDRNLDGYSDIEDYVPMNPDLDDGFTRDDPNSFDCFDIPGFPEFGQKFFSRDMRKFVVPTKLGVFSTGPFFHDHIASSLRMVVDPEKQAGLTADPQYGDASFPHIQKLFNGEHDIRGHEEFVQGASKVQLTLLSSTSSTHDSDTEAILEYIQSL